MKSIREERGEGCEMRMLFFGSFIFISQQNVKGMISIFGGHKFPSGHTSLVDVGDRYVSILSPGLTYRGIQTCAK